MTSYVNSYVEKTHLLRPPLGDVRNQPIKRLMAALIYIYIYPLTQLELHFQVDPSSVFTIYQHFLRDTRTTVATTYQQNFNEAQQGNFGVAKSLHMTNYHRRITPQ